MNLKGPPAQGLLSMPKRVKQRRVADSDGDSDWTPRKKQSEGGKLC